MAAPAIPDRARVVVIGGGVIGTSVAYHLAHMGWKDVVLLERDRLTSGTTWHAAGLIVTFGSTSETSTELRKYTRDLYRRLEAETGQATGFNPVGFIEVAADADRLEEFRRVAAFNRFCGVDVQEISPAEVKTLFPLARVDDILAGFYVKDDGRANPVDVTMALAKGARMAGARLIEGVRVDGVLRQGTRVTGVRTAHGDIAAEYVVNCTGMWARQLGERDRRHHPEPGGRALLPDHRADPRPAAVDAGAGGPGVLRLFPRRGRRPAGRSVRAGLRAVERRRHSRGFLVRRNSARLGAHDALSRKGDEPRPGLARGRDQEILLRAGELHARPAPDRRRGARTEELFRRRRTQLDRHPHRRRHRPAGGALDRPWHARCRRDRLQHRPPAQVPGQSRVSPRAHHRVARHGLQVPLPDHDAADRARREDLRDPRPAGGGARAISATSAAGKAPTGTRRKASSRRSRSSPGAGRTGFRGGRPSTAPRARP